MGFKSTNFFLQRCLKLGSKVKAKANYTVCVQQESLDTGAALEENTGMDMDAEAVTDAENNKNTARSGSAVQKERGKIFLSYLSCIYIIKRDGRGTDNWKSVNLLRSLRRCFAHAGP